MTLQIVRLTAENYKRLVAVDISPTGNIVTLSGKNAQGKSSVLDAIWAALAGGDASRATKQPIREGQDSASVTLDLGDYVVTRKWSKDDAGTLTVETPPTADGRKQKFSSPQALLDGLVGKRAFDPLAFTRQSAAEQVATLVSTVKLPFDPAELDRERAGVFDDRADVNRTVKQLEGQLAGLPKPDADTPTAEVSAADVIAEFEKAREHNEAITSNEAWAEKLRVAVDSLTKQIAELTKDLESTAAKIVEAEADRAKLGDPVDTAAISARLSSVEQTNAAIREGLEHGKVAARLAEARKSSTALTEKLAAIDKRKADALAKVKFPVEGLGFDDSGVTFKGVPFAQASAAEQLRVSAGLAMAADPELRILQVRDGSLLDSESMKVIEELAVERDFQVWIEAVSETDKLGIVIEDGSVKVVNS